MLLNAISILDLFLVFLRLVLGVLVLGGSVSLWRQVRRSRHGDAVQTIENRGYLLYLLAIVLLVLEMNGITSGGLRPILKM